MGFGAAYSHRMRSEMQWLFEIGYDAEVTRRRFLACCTFALAATSLALVAQATFRTETERLAQLLGWKPGHVIADVGAGDGEITLLLSEKTGPSGHVYSTEVDDAKLRHLQKLTASRENVTVLRGGSEESNLPAGCCDSILVRRVYHHFPHPATMNASFLAALKPGGTLAIIDFEDREGLPKIREEVPRNRGHHGMARALIIEEVTAAGFEAGAHPAQWENGDYCLIFRKPEAGKR
jgi:predicted methyltransferase